MQRVLASVPGVATDLTAEQRKLLDALWDHLCKTGESFPKRRLLPVLGQRPIMDVMEGMASGLMFEQYESGEKRYSLTMWGALSSSNGPRLLALYARLLDLVKNLHEDDNDLSSIDSDLIREKLVVSECELSELSSFAQLVTLPQMPMYFSGQSADWSTWYLAIREDVVDLFHAAGSVDYFVQKLVTGRQQVEPNNGLTQMLALQSAASWGIGSGGSGNVPKPANHFVAIERMEALQGIDHVDFDCTRLICLCDELNACAAGRHAHAVILLTRAILDHIPPIFGVGSFAEVASNYGGGGKSFKASAERLEKQARKVADRMLHQIIRSREVAPEMQEVAFSPELETILAEVCRLLKPPGSGNAKPPAS